MKSPKQTSCQVTLKRTECSQSLLCGWPQSLDSSSFHSFCISVSLVASLLKLGSLTRLSTHLPYFTDIPELFQPSPLAPQRTALCMGHSSLRYFIRQFWTHLTSEHLDFSKSAWENSLQCDFSRDGSKMQYLLEFPDYISVTVGISF